MGVKTTMALELEEWVIDSPASMFECLEDLAGQGYRGQVRVYHVNESLVWDLEINGDNIQPVNAVAGQKVVLLGGTLEAMTPEQYAAKFT